MFWIGRRWIAVKEEGSEVGSVNNLSVSRWLRGVQQEKFSPRPRLTDSKPADAHWVEMPAVLFRAWAVLMGPAGARNS